jgi:alpha-L-fucosidase 2
MYYFTTICYGSSIDMQILTDLFGYYGEASKILGLDREFAQKVAAARVRLVPPKVGKDGSLQEWTEGFERMDERSRHLAPLYGLYPGNVLSARRTPQFVDAIKAILQHPSEGDPGLLRTWGMALWARMYDGDQANDFFKGYIREQAYPQLFAKCIKALQVDGSLAVAAAITEMLMQSHEGIIDLLPALPKEWGTGRFNGVCARGAFQLDMKWKESKITSVEVLSRAGEMCRIKTGIKAKIKFDGKRLKIKQLHDGSIEFPTMKGGRYLISE